VYHDLSPFITEQQDFDCGSRPAAVGRLAGMIELSGVSTGKGSFENWCYPMARLSVEARNAATLRPK
jgi:hypothetical protein